VPTETFLQRHHHLGHADYGGLEVLAGSREQQRLERREVDWGKEKEYYERAVDAHLEEMDAHPDGLSRRLSYDEDYVQEHQCRRTNWQSRRYPNCNTFHELVFLSQSTPTSNSAAAASLSTTSEWDVKYLNHGAFRDGWLFRRAEGGPAADARQLHIDEDADEFVCKTFRYQKYLQFDMDFYYQIHKEAIIMERLTASDRIVTAYGHCGLSVLAESMPHEVAGEIILGMNEQPDLAGFVTEQQFEIRTEEMRQRLQLRDDDVVPMNYLSIEEKLDLAVVMAESIADIHGFEGGVIAHGDIHPVYVLISTNCLFNPRAIC